MNNIKEFNRNPISLSSFWLITGPTLTAILLLMVVIVFWKRQTAVAFRAYIWGGLGLPPRRKRGYEGEQRKTMAGAKTPRKRFPWAGREKPVDSEAPIAEP